MRSTIILLALVLGGCATASEVLPSLDHCERVVYDREGRAFTLHAECTWPEGVRLPL